MILKLSTAPASEPVTLAEAKVHLRIDTSTEDTDITRRITTARKVVEHILHRQLISATYKLYMKSFAGADGTSRIKLPYPPLSSVTSIAYVDANSASQTVASADYVVDTDSDPGRIYPAYGESWPATRGFDKDVTITYVAGYGTTGASVPEEYRDAIFLMLAANYEHRGDEAPVFVDPSAAPGAIPQAVYALLNQTRTWDFGDVFPEGD